MPPENLTALLPKFLSQTQALHDAIIPFAVVIAAIGVAIRACVRPDWVSIGWTLVRLMIIAIVVANIANWTVTIIETVNSMTTAVGAGTGADAAQQFSAFVNQRFATMGTNSNPWLWLFQGGQAIGAAILSVIVTIAAFVAEIVIWIAQGVRYIYLSLLAALSPVFFACFMIPQIANLGVRYATRIIAVCLWPFGWAIASIITQALLQLAINTTNNPSPQAQTISAGILWWTLGISLWIIVSTIGAPRMISHLIVTDGSMGLTRLAETTLGVATVGAGMATRGVSSVASGGTSAGAFRSNYATWPSQKQP